MDGDTLALAKDVEPAVTPPHAVIEAVEQAHSLLRFLCERGTEVDAACMDAVVAASAAVEAKAWTGDLERTFWPALSNLSRLAAPATVESIRAQDRAHGVEVRRWGLWGRARRLSQAELAARRYRTMAMATMALLLVVQMYWLAGTRLLAATPAATDFGGMAGLFGMVNSMMPGQAAEACAQGAGTPALDYQLCVGWSLQTVLDILRLFILPVCYGLLGACAYVVRQLTEDLEAVRFTMHCLVRYRLRLLLGALAGLSAAWFLRLDLPIEDHNLPATTNTDIADILNAGTEAFLVAAGPWAVAFLAGYGVELLFSTLDRLVGMAAKEGK